MADILELILNSSNILDPSLNGYNCEIDEEERDLTGELTPIYSKGRFCYSFRFIKSGDSKCYRIWISPSLVTDFGLAQRLNTISRYLKTHRKELPYFVDFEFLAKALHDRTSSDFPGIRMDWIQGTTLGDYLKAGHKNQNRTPSRNEIRKIAADFLEMCTAFRNHHIAHGDLSNKNIMIDMNGNIRLVDYDSLYVPDMGDKLNQTTGGAPGFQHYQRLNTRSALYASQDDDNFSQQIIYLSLSAIAESETIYKQRDRFIDKELLFASTDLESAKDFEASRAYKLIKSEFAPDSIQIKLLNEISKSLSGPLSNVKSITEILRQEKLAGFCIKCGHKFGSDNDRFCIKCGCVRYKLN